MAQRGQIFTDGVESSTIHIALTLPQREWFIRQGDSIIRGQAALVLGRAAAHSYSIPYSTSVAAFPCHRVEYSTSVNLIASSC